MEYRKLRGAAGWVAAASIAVAVPTAHAQTPPPPAATAPAPAAPAAEAPATPAAPAAEAPPAGLWVDGIHLSAQLESGIIANPFRPATGLNWGQLFTDHANQVQLNQLLLTANKPLDPKNSDYQWGFKIQFMYGSDARYTQFLGELNRVIPDQRNQFDVVEANVLAHLPWLTDGGIDLKVGQYPTPLGYETIDPSTNPFYSHSYIFQFGLPFKHTGALATTHVNDVLDIYSGIDTGTNTTFGTAGRKQRCDRRHRWLQPYLHGRQADDPGPDAFRAGAGNPGALAAGGQRQRPVAVLQRRADHLESDRHLDLGD